MVFNFPQYQSAKRLRISLAALALAVAGSPVLAQAPPAPTGEAAAVKKSLEQKLPGLVVTSITKSPYFGLYEIQVDTQMYYTDSKVRYLMQGSVFDTSTKQNLTEVALRKLNRIDFASLPLDLSFVRVKGNGQRKLAIFSDADCPFCARLENDLKNIDDVTIYTFLFPIDQLHPDSARKSKAIWCSTDRAQSWNEFFASGAVPDNKGDCDNPVAATAQLGQKLKVNATPTLVFADGSVVPGALPAAQLETEMKNADVEVKKIAAAKK